MPQQYVICTHAACTRHIHMLALYDQSFGELEIGGRDSWLRDREDLQ